MKLLGLNILCFVFLIGSCFDTPNCTIYYCIGVFICVVVEVLRALEYLFKTYKTDNKVVLNGNLIVERNPDEIQNS